MQSRREDARRWQPCCTNMLLLWLDVEYTNDYGEEAIGDVDAVRVCDGQP